MIRVVFVVAFFFVVVVLADPSDVRPSVVGAIGLDGLVVGAPGWTGVTSTVVVVPNEISVAGGPPDTGAPVVAGTGRVVAPAKDVVGAMVDVAPRAGADVAPEAVAPGVVVGVEAAVGGHGNA
jgi:hypothetical protein